MPALRIPLPLLAAVLASGLAGCEAINQFVKEVDARAQPAAEEGRKSMKKVEKAADENVAR
jgi:hypothetical protein